MCHWFQEPHKPHACRSHNLRKKLCRCTHSHRLRMYVPEFCSRRAFSSGFSCISWRRFLYCSLGLDIWLPFPFCLFSYISIGFHDHVPLSRIWQKLKMIYSQRRVGHGRMRRWIGRGMSTRTSLTWNGKIVRWTSVKRLRWKSQINDRWPWTCSTHGEDGVGSGKAMTWKKVATERSNTN
jgi:hypothetical protein